MLVRNEVEPQTGWLRTDHLLRTFREILSRLLGEMICHLLSRLSLHGHLEFGLLRNQMGSHFLLEKTNNPNVLVLLLMATKLGVFHVSSLAIRARIVRTSNLSNQFS